jgi:hypothetical protein
VTDSVAKIKWPATIDEAESAGYVYWQRKKEPCSCGEELVWFLTPKGAWIPMSRAKDGVRILPHHMVCHRIKEYRAANKKHAARTAKPKPVQQKLFE